GRRAALERRAEARPPDPLGRPGGRRAAAALVPLLHREAGQQAGGDDRAREEARPEVPEGRDGRVGRRRLPAQARPEEVTGLPLAALQTAKPQAAPAGDSTTARGGVDYPGVRPPRLPRPPGRGERTGMHKLVLLRHGESVWNRENRFTGWTDV